MDCRLLYLTGLSPGRESRGTSAEEKDTPEAEPAGEGKEEAQGSQQEQEGSGDDDGDGSEELQKLAMYALAVVCLGLWVTQAILQGFAWFSSMCVFARSTECRIS